MTILAPPPSGQRALAGILNCVINQRSCTSELEKKKNQHSETIETTFLSLLGSAGQLGCHGSPWGQRDLARATTRQGQARLLSGPSGCRSPLLCQVQA